MDRSFRDFESRDALQSLERGRVLLAEQISGLTKQSRDYAVWTSTYDFMVSRDPDYVEENYLPDSLDNLEVDFFALVGTGRQVVSALAVPAALGRSGDALLPWSGALRDQVLAEPMVLSLLQGADSKATLVFIDAMPYLISASSILDSDAHGPSRGALVFVRRLTPERIRRLQALTQTDFVLLRSNARQTRGTALVKDQRIVATLPLRDAQGKQIALLGLDSRRALSEQNAMLRLLGLFNILGMTLVALPLAYLIFDRMVLRKVSGLVADISRVRQFPESLLRLPEHGDHDLDQISTEINRLLDEVDLSHGKLRHDALHDSLTGLGNRQLLLDSLALARASLGAGRLPRFALLLLDLDGFKDINDLHGHLAGDQVLKAIAQRLGAVLGDGDMALRLGGDEFAMLIQSVNSSDPGALADRLLALIAQPLDCERRVLHVHASIGILAIDVLHRDDGPEDLLRKVDIAMYAAKQAGRNGYRYFNEAMQRALSERKALEEDLHAALDQDALEVWYQPVFDATLNTVASIEALSRWPHPLRGMIPPTVFVPLAESMQAMPRLDRSVLRKSCRMLRELRGHKPMLTLSVNLSVLTLMQPDITDYIVGLLRDNGLPGSALLLEVTETELARSERDLRLPMAALHAVGVRFQIDDFGTGYSSLARLHLLPLDTVKIDSSFVAELEQGDERMCQTIIRLAHHLHKRVTAEGVETATQRDSLVRLGCDEMQGYFFSRPVPGERLLEQFVSTNLA